MTVKIRFSGNDKDPGKADFTEITCATQKRLDAA